MGGNGNSDIDGSSLTIQTALDIARNSEGAIDSTVRDFLETTLREVWDRIEAAPDSYILTKDEFALFNYYRYRSASSSLAQSAIKRFWDNYEGENPTPVQELIQKMSMETWNRSSLDDYKYSRSRVITHEPASSRRYGLWSSASKRILQCLTASILAFSFFLWFGIGVSVQAPLGRDVDQLQSESLNHYHARRQAPKRPLLNVIEVYTPVTAPADANCQVQLMEYSFGASYGKPFVGQYSPPSCDFNRVIMNFTVTSSGRQFDRLALMYLNDTEIWRTSTAEPTFNGIIWTYVKDVSNYVNLFKEPQKIIFDLSNVIDQTYTGPFNTTLTATFFQKEQSMEPADMILPISARRSDANQASAFQVPDQPAINSLTIPRNAKKAVFSISACGQQAEEFWWSNVLSSTTQTFGGPNNTLLGFSPFREVQLLIDGNLAGVVWPFPVIFTGGVVPGFWRPVVGIDAYDLPEDQIDITPWLPVISDGKDHSYEIRVMGLNDDGKGNAALVTAPSYWVVTGKLFLWFDTPGSVTSGSQPVVIVPSPDFFVTAATDTTSNGTNTTLNYQVLAQRHISFVSTLTTTKGNNTVEWIQSLSFSNTGKYVAAGNNMTNDQTTSGEESSSNGYSRKFSYPLRSFSYQNSDPNTKSLTLGGTIDRSKTVTIFGNSVFPAGLDSFNSSSPYDGSTFTTRQNGSAFFKNIPSQNKTIGSGETEQTYVFSGLRAKSSSAVSAPTDVESSDLFNRHVIARNGSIVTDSNPSDGASVVQNTDNIRYTNVMADYTPFDVQKALGRYRTLPQNFGNSDLQTQFNP